MQDLNHISLPDLSHLDGPLVYLYEAFFREYNSEERFNSGTFYTPDPIVQFMVKGVNSLLREEFGLEKGLADDSVEALDFATGTGAFIAKLFQHILQQSPSPEDQQKLIPNHLLQHFKGYEYAMVPYELLKLELSKLLCEHGYENPNLEGLYLIDTLYSDEFIERR